jgi:hypothetical protein
LRQRRQARNGGAAEMARACQRMELAELAEYDMHCENSLRPSKKQLHLMDKRG